MTIPRIPEYGKTIHVTRPWHDRRSLKNHHNQRLSKLRKRWKTPAELCTTGSAVSMFQLYADDITIVIWVLSSYGVNLIMVETNKLPIKATSTNHPHWLPQEGRKDRRIFTFHHAPGRSHQLSPHLSGWKKPR